MVESALHWRKLRQCALVVFGWVACAALVIGNPMLNALVS